MAITYAAHKGETIDPSMTATAQAEHPPPNLLN
jgi:hypothetical protein